MNTSDACRQERVYKMVDGASLSVVYLLPYSKKYEKAPLFFLTSGGGWYTQSPERALKQFRLVVDILRNSGVAVAIPNYRVMGQYPDSTFAEVFSDVLDAMSYVRENAEQWNLDMDRVVVGGHSAGGHISMLLANAPYHAFPVTYDPSGLKYRACVSYSGPAFLYPTETCPTPVGIDCSYIYPNDSYCEELAHRWSPYDYISPDSPPTLLLHGAADPIVNAAASQMAWQRANALGAKFDLMLSSNCGHEWEPATPAAPQGITFENMQNLIAGWILSKLG